MIVDGVRLFDAVQATWNLLERSAEVMLRQAAAVGLTIIIKEALANGRLTVRNESPEFASKLALLQQEATRLGATIDALALSAALAQPWVTLVLSGAATVEQLASNLTASLVPWDEEAATALSPLVETPETYWRTRSRLAWN